MKQIMNKQKRDLLTRGHNRPFRCLDYKCQIIISANCLTVSNYLSKPPPHSNYEPISLLRTQVRIWVFVSNVNSGAKTKPWRIM